MSILSVKNLKVTDDGKNIVDDVSFDIDQKGIYAILGKSGSGKTELAKKAKALNLDAIHDTVHEMARDEARHGKAFAGLLERYFGK